MYKMFFIYIFFQTLIICKYTKYLYLYIRACSYKYNVNDTLRLSLIGLYTIYVYIVYTCVLCNHEDKFNRWVPSCPFSVTPYLFPSCVLPFFFPLYTIHMHKIRSSHHFYASRSSLCLLN